MAVRNILKGKNNPRLRKVSREVDEITPRILKLLDDLHETLKDADGCGLAAPQIGVLRRVVVIHLDGESYELINPVIKSVEGGEVAEEGCLSIPDKWYKVERPTTVVAEAMDRRGTVREYVAKDKLARAFCHEIEHLDGVLVVDNIYEGGEE